MHGRQRQISNAEVLTEDGKILTVSIAAYNVESTIAQCLDTCLACERDDELEVIVVDDGSTDATSRIVEEYAVSCPGTIKLLCKENGGYGTTVNASLEIASGKYFRLLDGDDWVDPEGLANLIDHLRENDVDIAIAPFVERGDHGSRIVDQVINVSGVVPFEDGLVPQQLSMHSLAYRTQLLRDSGLCLPGRRLYTDALFSAKPMSYVKNAFVTHVPVYQYRLDRDGQSMSEKSLVTHVEDLILVSRDLVEVYQSIDDKNSLASHIACTWAVLDITLTLRVLVGMEPNDEVWIRIQQLYALASKECVVSEGCRRHSRLYRMFARVPRLLYPLASKLYTLARMN